MLTRASRALTQACDVSHRRFEQLEQTAHRCLGDNYRARKLMAWSAHLAKTVSGPTDRAGVKDRVPLESLSLHSIVVTDPSSDRFGDGPSDFTVTIRTTDMNGILYRLARVEI